METIQALKKALTSEFSYREIEAAVINYIVTSSGLSSNGLDLFDNNADRIAACTTVLQSHGFSGDTETAIHLFESFSDDGAAARNGIVFTPIQLARYIVELTLKRYDKWEHHIKLLDPACGCGIFLIAAIDVIHEKFGTPVRRIIEDNLYGFDILNENVRRCRSLLKVACLKNGEPAEGLQDNIITVDALRADWYGVSEVRGFDIIIGNPPYISAKNIDTSTMSYLHTHYMSSVGMCNICEAFVEKAVLSISDNGKCCFVLPNTILSSRNSAEIRRLIADRGLADTIIEYKDIHVFDKAKVYSCVLLLNALKHSTLSYTASRAIIADDFTELPLSNFTADGFIAHDSKVSADIAKIERFRLKLGQYMIMQLCTQCDELYLVKTDNSGFYAEYNGLRYDLEPEMVRPLYKVSDFARVGLRKRYIIYPYVGGAAIPEEDLRKLFPNTYQYLITVKPVLGLRSKGKPNPDGWYAYGRRQGLKAYPKKILFPNYAAKPSFRLIEDDALFINGGGIAENNELPLHLLLRVLNSDIMAYYVRHTSKAIQRGYYLYNKTSIGRFSIPDFSENEKDLLATGSDEQVNEMLLRKYDITI